RTLVYSYPVYFLTLGGTIASLADFATRNFTTFLAAILIDSPVAGLRPIRALRSTRTSRPMPGSTKRPFFFTSLIARLDKLSSTPRACLLVNSPASASERTSCVCVILFVVAIQPPELIVMRNHGMFGDPYFTGFRSTRCFACRYH